MTLGIWNGSDDQMSGVYEIRSVDCTTVLASMRNVSPPEARHFAMSSAASTRTSCTAPWPTRRSLSVVLDSTQPPSRYTDTM